jgi:hypothetical protein
LARTISSPSRLVGAALGMAQDGEAGARFLQHRRRDVAGMRPAVLGVAVLRTDEEAARPGHGEREQSEGRADRDVDAGRRPGGGGDGAELAKGRPAAVHLPIAGDELAAYVHSLAFPPAAGTAALRVRTRY